MENQQPCMIEVDPEILSELQYMVELFNTSGTFCLANVKTVDQLIGYILASVADGSRRPGSWERQLLVTMGLVASSPEHQIPRPHYGRPEPVEPAEPEDKPHSACWFCNKTSDS